MNLKYWCNPVDVIAAIIILGSFILVAFGYNGVIKEMLLAVTFYYFGVKTTLSSDKKVE